jgi:orotidine-5'-phosphate decarboxylase/orotate phosphoribosyltransferase
MLIKVSLFQKRNSGGVLMQSNQTIAQHLDDTTGFQDVPPTILTSGQLGCYYVNTEKLARDNGEFNDYGGSAEAMYRHALAMAEKHPEFNEDIEIIAAKVKELMEVGKPYVISGGQRRDWLFSAPVAHKLGLRHVALYKQEPGQNDRIEVQDKEGKVMRDSLENRIEGATAIHIVDLLTEGSSCIDKSDNTGWIPMLRKAGVEIKDLLAVVTRKQGGEDNLAAVGVTVHPFVAIDEDFLSKHSKNPENAVAYFKDPEKWSREYLAKNGAMAFAKNFDPLGKNIDRAGKFWQRYGAHLDAELFGQPLRMMVGAKYGMPIEEIVAGKKLYDFPENRFATKWNNAVKAKNSILCIGLDPVEYWQRQNKTLPEGAYLKQWCLDYIVKVAPFAAAIKPNRKFVCSLSRNEREWINKLSHGIGLVVIDDEKLPDIGDTNDAGLYNSMKEGYDAVTYSPFPGNLEEVTRQAHGRGLGVIGMCIMSNPEHNREKNKLVNVREDKETYRPEDVLVWRHEEWEQNLPAEEYFVKQYVQLAHDAAKYGWDGVVIGAPSKKNHITEAEIRTIHHYLKPEQLVLMPGIGTQGGEAKFILDVFGADRVIANVGSGIMFAKDQVAEAKMYRDMLNSLRSK